MGLNKERKFWGQVPWPIRLIMIILTILTVPRF